MAFASVRLIEQDERDGSIRIQRAPQHEPARWAALDRDAGGISVEAVAPDPEHELHLVVIPGADAMLLLDRQALASNAVQMGLLGSYDPTYFRPVYGNLAARVYEVLAPKPPVNEVE
jgi:hypothetical protein